MIRIITVTVDASAAANVGGPVHQSYRTFDIEAPELERYLAMAGLFPPNSLCQRSILGVEVVDSASGGE